MRAFILLLFIAVAVPCHAGDPLETLNTVEDAVSTMEHTLKTRAGQREGKAHAAEPAAERLPLDDRLYFVSDEELGAREWLSVRPCTEEAATAGTVTDTQSCVARPDGTVALGAHYWRSRPATREELRVGTVVVAREGSGDGGWVLARITDLSGLDLGFVSVSARFRAPLRGLRVLE